MLSSIGDMSDDQMSVDTVAVFLVSGMFCSLRIDADLRRAEIRNAIYLKSRVNASTDLQC